MSARIGTCRRLPAGAAQISVEVAPDIELLFHHGPESSKLIARNPGHMREARVEPVWWPA